MLGHYENFPETVHGIARFTHKASAKRVQQSIVATFCRLNRRKCRLEELAHYSTPTCEVDFELGFGEGTEFIFLDKDESVRLEVEIAKRPLLFLDFLCILQYHVVDNYKGRVPLKFDYYMFRFAFDKNFMEFLVSHERGPQHVHVEDLMSFIMKEVKRKLAEQHLITIQCEEMRTI